MMFWALAFSEYSINVSVPLNRLMETPSRCFPRIGGTLAPGLCPPLHLIAFHGELHPDDSRVVAPGPACARAPGPPPVPPRTSSLPEDVESGRHQFGHRLAGAPGAPAAVGTGIRPVRDALRDDRQLQVRQCSVEGPLAQVASRAPGVRLRQGVGGRQPWARPRRRQTEDDVESWMAIHAHQ